MQKFELQDLVSSVENYFSHLKSIGEINFCIYASSSLAEQAQLLSKKDFLDLQKDNSKEILYRDTIHSSKNKINYCSIPLFVTGDSLNSVLPKISKSAPYLYKYRLLTRFKKLSNLLIGDSFKISFLDNPFLVEKLRQKARAKNVHKLKKISNYKIPNTNLDTDGLNTLNNDTVIIAMNSLEQSGAERFALLSAEYLNKKLKKCIILIENASSNMLLEIARIKNLEVQKYPIAQIIPSEWRETFLINFIHNNKPAYFHIHHSKLAYRSLPGIKSKTPQIKTIDTLHLLELPHGGMPRISGRYTNFIDFHHVISHQLSDFFIRRYKAPETKCKLGYLYKKNNEIVTATELTNNPEITITFIGRMVLQKRPYMIVLLAQYIKETNPSLFEKLKFKMVGSGFLLETCKSLMYKNNIQHKFEFIDYLIDSQLCLQKTDIFILPSENEGIALTCMEAIKNNCLVLSCDVGAQAELIPKTNLLSLDPEDFVKEAYRSIKLFFDDTKYKKSILIEQRNRLNNLAENSWINAFDEIYFDLDTNNKNSKL